MQQVVDHGVFRHLYRYPDGCPVLRVPAQPMSDERVTREVTEMMRLAGTDEERLMHIGKQGCL